MTHGRCHAYSLFINADPAGFDGGMNWYAYANNSPLMYVDPDGEIAFLAVPLLMHAGRIAATHAIRKAAPIVARAVVRSGAQVALAANVSAQATVRFAQTSAAQARIIGQAGLGQANYRVHQVNQALASEAGQIVASRIAYGSFAGGVANQTLNLGISTSGLGDVDYGSTPFGSAVSTNLALFTLGEFSGQTLMQAPSAFSNISHGITNRINSAFQNVDNFNNTHTFGGFK